MKRILGLDLGTNSIGWAVVEEGENEECNKIIGLGCRIVPLDISEKNGFQKGQGISKNQDRTTKRTQRKGYDRYQLRRKALACILRDKQMLPTDELTHIDKLELWTMRSKAASEKISLQEFGRVLLHLNQKRGYKSARSEANLDKQETKYVENILNRYAELKAKEQTIGQYFFQELEKNPNFRIKELVFPRHAYIEEFSKICKKQQEYYPQIITDNFIDKLCGEIIYYQRRLKSQKGLVSICEFEGKIRKDSNGNDMFTGPRVAHRSSPISQICKIYENINNITIVNKYGNRYILNPMERNGLFEHLDNNKKVTQTEIFKLLRLKNTEWKGNAQLKSGLTGNITKCQIIECFGERMEEYKHLLEFNIDIITKDDETICNIDEETGEILFSHERRCVSSDVEKQPLYRIWHTIYSINDSEECYKALVNNFSIPPEIAERLSKLDLVKQDFANKSVKAMRKLIPYLMDGYMYSEAASFAGYNHSNSQTKDENEERILADCIKLLPKNSIRQPIVEKILNQTINVVNAIIEKYGRPDEVRVELARELKQSKDERADAFKANNKREREAKEIAERLEKEYHLRATRNNIIKWRLYHELNGNDSKLNAVCVYCGKPISLSDAINGNDVDVEHIIPKSRLFDDSQTNKTLAHRHCNATKGSMTAADFMKAKGEHEFNLYVERVNEMYKKGQIGRGKLNKLLMTADKIPDDFIDRQLRQSQYIARKAVELITPVCRNVWTTGGSVTAELRHLWGWNSVLENLQLPKYRELGQTEWIEVDKGNGHTQNEERIIDWTKRNDHRHHAIDALTIACTKQGFIQRFNKLNADHNLVEKKDGGVEYSGKKGNLEKYIVSQRPFTTSEVECEVSKVLISFKSGKKVATVGKRKINKNGKKVVVQDNIIIPRGSLHEESVYGRISTIEREQSIKFIFNNPEKIIKPYIKALVEERIAECNNDHKKAITSLKENPIYLDEEKTIELTHATCYRDEYVIKYPLNILERKNINDIIDEPLRKKVKQRFDDDGLMKDKDKLKDLENRPLWYNEAIGVKINTIRCYTGLSSVEPIRKDENGKNIAFVKPGNNHHISIYVDPEGKMCEHVCSFWHAVQRKLYGFPVIIKNPQEIWEEIINKKEDYPQDFLDKLPGYNLTFEISMQQNEMFIIGLNNDEICNAIAAKDNVIISKYLYRVQKISKLEYVFRHHLETRLLDGQTARDSKIYVVISSMGSFKGRNPVKVRVNLLGEIEIV